MGRKRSAVQLVKRVIKVSLHPVQQRHLIDMIDAAPNKARLVVGALEGRPAAPKPETASKDDELRDQLSDFLM